MYKSILCAVDFSDPSRAAFDRAVALAREFGARLTIVHVLQLPPAPPDVPVDPQWFRSVMDRVEGVLLSWKEEAIHRGLDQVEVAMLEGAAWDMIVKRAGEGGADLVLMGTHGRSGIKKVLLGSVAERVVRHAPCDVLVVRQGS
jgi:nucleotide-binding universal stress UspA family protein